MDLDMEDFEDKEKDEILELEGQEEIKEWNILTQMTEKKIWFY